MSKYFVLLLMILVGACKESQVTGWKAWTATDTAVFKGQYSLTGDPAITRDGNIYRMFYTGFDAFRNPQGPEICQATSGDGYRWTNVPVADPIEGRMLYTNSNNWSTAHETSYSIHFNGKYYLYFIGYKDTGAGVFGSGPVSVGVAVSSDGINFSQLQSDPVIIGSPEGLDRDALSSPSIITYKDSLLMIYTGYCYSGCGSGITTSMLAATSVDGINWIKKSKPIITKEEISWASKGAAEAEIILGPDNLYYLFMSSVDTPHVIGVARSISPFGPWDVDQQPIIDAGKSFSVTGALAPSVLVEGSRVRLWYHGSTATSITIGYAESTWPLKN